VYDESVKNAVKSTGFSWKIQLKFKPELLLSNNWRA
jgi:hypothetical protein